MLAIAGSATAAAVTRDAISSRSAFTTSPCEPCARRRAIDCRSKAKPVAATVASAARPGSRGAVT